MPQVEVNFGVSVQKPAKLGTVYLRPTTPSALAYAQNIEVQNSEYGEGVAVPGPALTTIGNNSELTGVPFLHSLVTMSTSNVGWLWFAEGLLGSTAQIRRVMDVESGETPSIDTTGDFAVDHSSHSGEVVQDMVMRIDGADEEVYIAGVDATDAWVQKFAGDSASPSLSAVTILASSDVNFTHHLLLASNTKIYVGYGSRIDSIALDDSVAGNVLPNIPDNYGITDLAEWQLKMAIAYNTNYSHGFALRRYAGESGILLWNYSPNSSYELDKKCPSRYISALVVAPTGNLFVFGGVDEGYCTVWEFTGYGYLPVFSYIGDLPRSQHSVCFDGQGRLMFNTADGQICRYNLQSTVFEHLGTIATASSAGGILVRGVTGSEFIAASGSGSTYTMKRMVFGSYIGDGDASDGVTTPLVISEQVRFSSKVTINNIEFVGSHGLIAGDNLEPRLYKNGSTTAIAYGDDINSTNDGTVRSSWRREQGEPEVDTCHVGVAYKATDARATSPGMIKAVIDFDPTE